MVQATVASRRPAQPRRASSRPAYDPIRTVEDRAPAREPRAVASAGQPGELVGEGHGASGKTALTARRPRRVRARSRADAAFRPAGENRSESRPRRPPRRQLQPLIAL